MNMDEKDISIAEDEDSCTNGCPVRFVRIMVTPWKMNGWDPKITQLKVIDSVVGVRSLTLRSPRSPEVF